MISVQTAWILLLAICIYSHTDRANNVRLGALQISSMSRDSCDVTTQQRLAVSVIMVVLPHFGACKTSLQRHRREGQYAASCLGDGRKKHFVVYDVVST